MLDIKKKASKWLRAGAKWLLGLAVVFLLFDLFFPVDTQIAYSPIVLAADSTVLHAYLTPDQQWRMKVSLPEITPELRTAILFKEDKHFYSHPGFNLFSFFRAAGKNISKARRTSGASTISMQVIRMLEPRPRNYLSKAIEVIRAMQLELHNGKNEILQLYFNLVPYGSNIQGVKAASMLYFNKTPDQLSLAEITALSIIPNRPNSLLIGRDNGRIVRERIKWLDRFSAAALFPPAILRDAVAEPLNAYRHAAPAGLPQLSARVKKDNPGLPAIYTTINATFQQRAEQIVSEYMDQLKLHNINNASVLIVDNETRQVITYIGSSDFKDNAHFGQVDGVRALRSPGSTLKPLLYGMGFDAGFITPLSVIPDIPVNLKGYCPENYDKQFRGNVTIDYALRNSLNIPAVKVLDKLTVPVFIAKMKQAGFTSVWKRREKLGLSVILGGCGVRLEELTALYCCYANNGSYSPIRVQLPSGVGVEKDSTVQILSPAAGYMVNQILSELLRPDLPNGYEQVKGLPKIAWKTGTSYGRKDAWSIGYNKRYTVGIWIGNFSGLGIPELSGANTATPLLFRLFNGIDQRASDDWVEPPASVSFRLVCAETGKTPASFCNNQVMGHYIPGVSTNDACDHLKEAWLSPDEKITYCTSCLPPAGYKTRLLPNIDPALCAWYEQEHIAFIHLPPHNPACTRTFSGTPPIITSLTNGMTYLIADKEQQKLQLTCATGSDVSEVFWYINDKFFASAPPGKKLFFQVPGTRVKISCTDDKGRSTHISVLVKFI